MTQATVEFKNNSDGIRGLSILQGMHESNELQITREDQMLVLAVLASQDWDRPNNRFIKVELKDGFNPDTLRERLGRFAEAVATKNVFQGLLFRREASRKAFAEQLINDCVPQTFIDEMYREWGVKISARFADEEADRRVLITVSGMGNDFIISLHGNTGSVVQNGACLYDYEGPEQIRAFIRESIDLFLQS